MPILEKCYICGEQQAMKSVGAFYKCRECQINVEYFIKKIVNHRKRKTGHNEWTYDIRFVGSHPYVFVINADIHLVAGDLLEILYLNSDSFVFIHRPSNQLFYGSVPFPKAEIPVDYTSLFKKEKEEKIRKWLFWFSYAVVALIFLVHFKNPSPDWILFVFSLQSLYVTVKYAWYVFPLVVFPLGYYLYFHLTSIHNTMLEPLYILALIAVSALSLSVAYYWKFLRHY